MKGNKITDTEGNILLLFYFFSTFSGWGDFSATMSLDPHGWFTNRVGLVLSPVTCGEIGDYWLGI